MVRPRLLCLIAVVIMLSTACVQQVDLVPIEAKQSINESCWYKSEAWLHELILQGRSGDEFMAALNDHYPQVNLVDSYEDGTLFAWNADGDWRNAWFVDGTATYATVRYGDSDFGLEVAIDCFGDPDWYEYFVLSGTGMVVLRAWYPSHGVVIEASHKLSIADRPSLIGRVPVADVTFMRPGTPEELLRVRPSLPHAYAVDDATIAGWLEQLIPWPGSVRQMRLTGCEYMPQFCNPE